MEANESNADIGKKAVLPVIAFALAASATGCVADKSTGGPA
jgi:hypothetical protein